MECCYGDVCERIPVKLVACKYCDGQLHHTCQAKYEFTYGIESAMVYICRPCIDKKYHDIIERAKAKIQADDETDSDGTVDLCGDDNCSNEAVANAVQVIDGANGAGVAAIRTNEVSTDNVPTSDKEVASDGHNEETMTSGKETHEEKTDDTCTNEEKTDDTNEEKTDDTNEVQAATTASTPRQKRPTTARNVSTYTKKKKRANCKKGARIKIRRDNLFHILKSDKQKEDIQKYGNSRNFHGEIISGNGKQGYNIKFDDLPAEDQMVYVRRRNIIVVLEEGEEEVECDHVNVDLNEEVIVPNKDEHKDCITAFCDMSDEEVMNAMTFTLKDSTTTIVWDILPDGEYIEWDEVKSNGETWKKEIEINNDTIMNDIFFDDFFPCIKGHAKLIDDYHSSRNSPYYSTVRNDQIKFHDPDVEDPDYLVKIAYTIMIAAVSEVEQGVENLWKRGRSNGRRDYPNFGRYMSKNTFKAFQSAAPYCFCDKKFWYVDKRDRPWDIFLPCLNSYNEKRKKLVVTALLMLDESMHPVDN